MSKNRKERRAAFAKARTKKLNPIIAKHEAGHGVGRVLTAGALGYQPIEAIAYIEIGDGVPLGRAGDVAMISAGVT